MYCYVSNFVASWIWVWGDTLPDYLCLGLKNIFVILWYVCSHFYLENDIDSMLFFTLTFFSLKILFFLWTMFLLHMRLMHYVWLDLVAEFSSTKFTTFCFWVIHCVVCLLNIFIIHVHIVIYWAQLSHVCSYILYHNDSYEFHF